MAVKHSLNMCLLCTVTLCTATLRTLYSSVQQLAKMGLNSAAFVCICQVGMAQKTG